MNDRRALWYYTLKTRSWSIYKCKVLRVMQLSHNMSGKVISWCLKLIWVHRALCRQVQINKVLSTSRPHLESYTLLNWGEFGERSVCVTYCVHIDSLNTGETKTFAADPTWFEGEKFSVREAAGYFTARGGDEGKSACKKKTASRAVTGWMVSNLDTNGWIALSTNAGHNNLQDKAEGEKNPGKVDNNFGSAT